MLVFEEDMGETREYGKPSRMKTDNKLDPTHLNNTDQKTKTPIGGRRQVLSPPQCQPC